MILSLKLHRASFSFTCKREVQRRGYQSSGDGFVYIDVVLRLMHDWNAKTVPLANSLGTH